MFLIYNNKLYEINGNENIYYYASLISNGDMTNIKHLEEYQVGIIDINLSQEVQTLLTDQDQFYHVGSMKEQSIKIFFKDSKIDYNNQQKRQIRIMQNDFMKKMNKGFYVYRNDNEIYMLKTVNIDYSNMDKLVVVQSQDIVSRIENLKDNAVQDLSGINNFQNKYLNILEKHAEALFGAYNYFIGYLIKQERSNEEYRKVQFNDTYTDEEGIVLWQQSNTSVGYGFHGWLYTYQKSIDQKSTLDQDQILFQKTIQVLTDREGNLRLENGQLVSNTQYITEQTFANMVQSRGKELVDGSYKLTLQGIPDQIDVRDIKSFGEPLAGYSIEDVDLGAQNRISFTISQDEFSRIIKYFNDDIERSISSQKKSILSEDVLKSQTNIYKYEYENGVEYLPYSIFGYFYTNDIIQDFYDYVLDQDTYFYSFAANNNPYNVYYEMVPDSIQNGLSFYDDEIPGVMNGAGKFSQSQIKDLFIYYRQKYMMDRNFQYFGDKYKQLSSFIGERFQFSVPIYQDRDYDTVQTGVYFMQQGDKKNDNEKAFIESGYFLFPQYYEHMDLEQLGSDKTIESWQVPGDVSIKGSKSVGEYARQFQLLDKSIEDNVRLKYVFTQIASTLSVVEEVEVYQEIDTKKIMLMSYQIVYDDIYDENNRIKDVITVKGVKELKIKNITYSSSFFSEGQEYGSYPEVGYPVISISQARRGGIDLIEQLFMTPDTTVEGYYQYLNDNFKVIQIPLIYSKDLKSGEIEFRKNSGKMQRNYPVMFNRYGEYECGRNEWLKNNQDNSRRHQIDSSEFVGYVYDKTSVIPYQYIDRFVGSIDPFLLDQELQQNQKRYEIYFTDNFLRLIDTHIQKFTDSSKAVVDQLLNTSKIFRYRSYDQHAPMISFHDNDVIEVVDSNISQKGNVLLLEEFIQQLQDEYEFLQKLIIDEEDVLCSKNQQLKIYQDYKKYLNIGSIEHNPIEIFQKDPREKDEDLRIIEINSGAMFDLSYQLYTVSGTEGIYLLRISEVDGRYVEHNVYLQIVVENAYILMKVDMDLDYDFYSQYQHILSIYDKYHNDKVNRSLRNMMITDVKIIINDIKLPITYIKEKDKEGYIDEKDWEIERIKMKVRANYVRSI